MSSLKLSHRSALAQPHAAGARQVAYRLLRGASAVLARLARQLAVHPPARRRDVQLEYHADAGAPEGALYVDGQLVGFVDGVKRI